MMETWRSRIAGRGGTSCVAILLLGCLALPAAAQEETGYADASADYGTGLSFSSSEPYYPYDNDVHFSGGFGIVDLFGGVSVPAIGSHVRDLGKWRQVFGWPDFGYRYHRRDATVAIERHSWRRRSGQGAARLFIKNYRVRSIEYWIDDPAMVTSPAPIPELVASRLGATQKSERLGRCTVATSDAARFEGTPAARYVRSHDTSPLPTGLRPGEGWLELGGDRPSALLAACEERYAFLGYVLGMNESAAGSVWTPIDGGRRKTKKNGRELRVQTKHPSDLEKRVDASLHFDENSKLSRIEVRRFSRRQSRDVALSRQRRADAPDMPPAGEPPRALHTHECPAYLVELTALWGAPQAHFEDDPERERAVWFDAEAGVAIAAEQSLSKGCTELSFTMRRMNELRPMDPPSVLYERIRSQ